MTAQDRKRHRSGSLSSSRTFDVEDDRGWAGQHGQKPANIEEKSYRPDTVNEKPEKRPKTRQTARGAIR